MAGLVKVKAKDKDCWAIWHYGTMISPAVMDVDGASVSVVPRTVCEDTGLTCKGRAVYEHDWIAVEGDGETHKFLVAWSGTEYRAFEDDDISYDLRNVLKDRTCRIVGNLYD